MEGQKIEIIVNMKDMTKAYKAYLIGAASGFANGMFGSGGGSIVVPGMEKYLGVETHKAHATAIAVILPLCAVSAAFYLFKAEANWLNILYLSAGGLCGGPLGARLLKKLPASWLRRIFGMCMIAAAIRMIF
jgi:uncharacterized membrane protein YfcA